MSLGYYVSALREQKNLTLRDLAKKSGVNHETIRKIETGDTENPGIQVILALSKALNVSVMKLIMAYQGQDPDQATDKELDEDLREARAIQKALEELRRQES